MFARVSISLSIVFLTLRLSNIDVTSVVFFVSFFFFQNRKIKGRPPKKNYVFLAYLMIHSFTLVDYE